MSAAKTILVMGSTGNQGGQCVKDLAARNIGNHTAFRILALTRDPASAKAQALTKLPGVELVQGDGGDAASVFQHGQKLDGLFLMQTSTLQAEEVPTGKKIVDLAKEKGVGHVVYTGVDMSGMEETPTSIFNAKHAIASYLKSSGVGYTILNPVSFYENLPSQNQIALVQSYNPAVPRKIILSTDIGYAAAECFADPARFLGRELNIAGDSLYKDDFVRVFKEEKGIDVFGLEKPQPGSKPAFVQIMLDHLDTNPYVASPEETRQYFPKVRNFRDWVRNDYPA